MTHQIEIDSLRIDPPAVKVSIPAPEALIIFGLGLAGLGYTRRNRAA